MLKMIHQITIRIFKGIVLIGLALPCLAQDQHGVNSTIDREKLIAFVDSLVEANIVGEHLPGVSISIVQNDSILLSKGYGFADVETQRRVEADVTLFRIASITKLFTATAIMQLYEQGKLQLHEPVVNYITDIDIKKEIPADVTFHQLLTHTSGIDNTSIQDAAKTVDEVIPLRALVAEYLPDQSLPAGAFYHYTNYGMALLGFLVSEISGLEYEAYMEKHIFSPLEMTKSFLAQPLAPNFIKDLASGYDWDEELIKRPLDYSNVSPADGMITTAKDMAAFMIAHLNGGTYRGQQLLKPETIQLMHDQQFPAFETNYGMGYGFEESFAGNRKLLRHTGGQYGFVSLLELIPEENFGVFITQNGRNGSQGFRNQLTVALRERFLSSQTFDGPIASSLPEASYDQSKYLGTYRQFDYTRNTVEKMAVLMGALSAEVQVFPAEGGLGVFGASWKAVEKNAFQVISEGSSNRIHFKEDDQGQITHMMFGRFAYEKVPFYQTEAIRNPVLLVSLIVILAYTVYWPVRRFGKRSTINLDESPLARRAHQMGYWSGAGYIIFIILFVLWFIMNEDKPLDYGINLMLKATLLVSLLSGLLSLLLPIATGWVWLKSQFSIKRKIFYTLNALFVMVLTLYLYDVNMIGFNF